MDVCTIGHWITKTGGDVISQVTEGETEKEEEREKKA